MKLSTLHILPIAVIILMIYACASTGTPDGGPYDETPPKFVRATPEPNAINNKRKKVSLEFDEFIKIENAAEKVIISPPQAEMPEVFVLETDHMKHFQVAETKKPVFYCRLDSVEKSRETNTVAWMDGKIAVHVLCPAADIRLKWLMALANSLSLAGEVVMLDKSPMKINRLQVNTKADYLKEGQLLVTVHYGLLRYKNKPHIITEVNTDFS